MRAGAGAVIALCLGGCVVAVGDAGPAVDPEGERQATRAIWGIVPEAPRRKADLRPTLIRGAAVAVTPDTLLADCAAVSGKTRVGLVRHNKYRLAEVARTGGGQLCRLKVAKGPLSPLTGYRSFADLRVGEPVVALASRTARDILVARGWLAGKGDPSDPFLEVTALLPPTGSAVLLDGSGNLLGLGAVAELPDATLLAVPVQPQLAPALANRDLGPLGPLLAGAVADPRAQPTQLAFVVALGADRDSLEQATTAPRADSDRSPPAAGGEQGVSANGAAAGSGSEPDPASGGPASPAAGATGGTPDSPTQGSGPSAGGPEPPGQAADRGRRGRGHDAHERGGGRGVSSDDRNHGRGDRGRRSR